jgi:hypothetical protein
MIVLRYARNLIDGQGWVYNPGEWVNASTSPLNTLLIAMGLIVTGDWKLSQVLVFSLSLGTAATIIFALLARRNATGAYVGALCMLATPVFHTTIGLESTVLAALLGATVLLHDRGRRDAAAIALALAVLARADALLLLPILGVRSWRSSGPASAARFAALTLLALAPWLLFSCLRFRTPFPQTLAGKLAQRDSGYWGDGLLFLKGLRRSFVEFDARGLAGSYRLPLAILIVSALAGFWRVREARPLILVGILQAACYSALNVPYYHWYGVPLHYALVVGYACMCSSIAGRSRAGAAACGLAFVLLCAPDPTTQHPETNRPYRETAEWLDQHTQRGGSHACLEIGKLGWFLHDRRIIDMCGLVTPSGIDAIRNGDLAWWIRCNPDYIILHDPPAVGFELDGTRTPAFRAYQRIWSDHGMSVFAREKR